MARTRGARCRPGSSTPAGAHVRRRAGAPRWRCCSFLVNPLTAWLTLASLIGYAVIYTVYLKRATPQNIVIGGAAGATPPVLGWTAVTGTVDPDALLLFLIIFAWTPPHFWALAIAPQGGLRQGRHPDAAGDPRRSSSRACTCCSTRSCALVTLLPYLTGMSGLIYLAAALILNGRFLRTRSH